MSERTTKTPQGKYLAKGGELPDVPRDIHSEVSMKFKALQQRRLAEGRPMIDGPSGWRKAR